MKLAGRVFLASAALLLTAPADAAPEAAEQGRFPCISVCCVKPTVTTKETVPIRFFVTDWNGSRVRLGDSPLRFDIHIRCVCPDGKVRERTLEKSPAGNGEIELRSQPKGEYHFCVWAVDEKGRESHRAWRRFRVVEPDEQDAPADAVAKMTYADLVKYAVTTNSADGLGRLLAEKAKAGIRKVELPRGDYIVSPTNCVSIPGGMTLDLNGATLRRRGGDCAVVAIDGVRDAHLVNGTLDGGRFEFRSDALYCSVEGVAVTNVADFGVVGVAASARQTWYDPIPVPPSDDFVALDGAMKSGWLQVQLPDATIPAPDDRLLMVGRWYDAKKNMLSAETLLAYRLVPIPAKAAYLSVEGGRGMALAHCRVPQNCVVRNCNFSGCGDDGASVGAIGNMRFEGCVFESCIFREDRGCGPMQDVAFERCGFKRVSFARNLAGGEQTFGGCVFEGCRFWGVNGGCLRFEDCKFKEGDMSAGSASVQGSTAKLVFAGCTFDVGEKSFLKAGAHAIGSVLIDKCRADGPSGACEQFIDIFDFRPPKDAYAPGMVVVMDSEFGGGIPAIVGCSTLSDGACLKPGEKPCKLDFAFSRNKLSSSTVDRGPMPQ